MIKSPRQKFVALAQVRSDWEKITQTEAFDKACHYALLQMLGKMPRNLEMSADCHMQMVGAQNFIHTLTTIHEQEEQTIAKKTESLNYQAGV